MVGNITIAPGNTWVWLTVQDITGSGHCVQNLNCPWVASIDLNGSVASGVTSYSTPVTTTDLTAGGYNGGILRALGPEFPGPGVGPAQQSASADTTAGAAREPFIVPGNPTGGFIAPVRGWRSRPGNVTLV